MLIQQEKCTNDVNLIDARIAAPKNGGWTGKSNELTLQGKSKQNNFNKSNQMS